MLLWLLLFTRIDVNGAPVWVDAVEADGVGDGEMDAVVVIAAEAPVVTQDTGEDGEALLDDRTGGSGADLEDLGRV